MDDAAASKVSMLQSGDDEILDLLVQQRHNEGLLPARLVAETRTLDGWYELRQPQNVRYSRRPRD